MAAVKQPEKMMRAFELWQSRVITQAEAAKACGVSQPTFSRFARRELENRTDTAFRFPEGFEECRQAWLAGDIGSRDAGERLGVSKTTFMDWVHKADEAEHKGTRVGDSMRAKADEAAHVNGHDDRRAEATEISDC